RGWQRPVRPGTRAGAGASVGLQDVTVDHDRVFAEGLQVHAWAQAPTDQPRDLMSTPTDAPLDTLPVGPGGRGTRQHRILAGDPAQAGTPAPAWHALGDTRGAQHP